jgi:phosphatidylinositol 4-kinase
VLDVKNDIGNMLQQFSFRKSIHSLAHVLAKIRPTPWEKVQTLFKYCPQENAAGVFCLDSRGQDAVIALGIYFLESGLQYEKEIVSYLLRLSRALPKAIWVDDDKPNKIDSMQRYFPVIPNHYVFLFLFQKCQLLKSFHSA